MDYHAPYMTWYCRITCRFITPMDDFGPMRYQATALSAYLLSMKEVGHQLSRQLLDYHLFEVDRHIEGEGGVAEIFLLGGAAIGRLHSQKFPQKREVKRFADLTADEISDLWLTAQKVGSRLECHHKASSVTFTIQDGPQAGQTVPHVHIHILPRKVGDFEKNDEIYDAIDENEKELKKKLDLDEERKDRNPEEMAQEADEYKVLFS
uniref:HIT domain-containing protein n=1 Tax=Vitis vinifera TaxID=29760 RepID=A5BYT5_VITVI|nr:hypothetical protein VITISV_016936 [Vitis vinifera]